MRRVVRTNHADSRPVGLLTKFVGFLEREELLAFAKPLVLELDAADVHHQPRRLGAPCICVDRRRVMSAMSAMSETRHIRQK